MRIERESELPVGYPQHPSIGTSTYNLYSFLASVPDGGEDVYSLPNPIAESVQSNQQTLPDDVEIWRHGIPDSLYTHTITRSLYNHIHHFQLILFCNAIS